MNAITMGTVTLLLRMCGGEDVSAYEAMSRLRINDSIIVDLPRPVENYFAQKMRYHHNVSTMATDGPAILVYKQASAFAVNPYRLYVENLLSSTPTKFKAPDPRVRITSYFCSMKNYQDFRYPVRKRWEKNEIHEYHWFDNTMYCHQFVKLLNCRLRKVYGCVG